MVAHPQQPGKRDRKPSVGVILTHNRLSNANWSKYADASIVNPTPVSSKMPTRNSNMMRVASGEARGIRLKGAAVAGIRPTTERVRAAIFNILESSQVVDRRVVDLFAGTGSLGIEALSRGAAWADFVERNRRQCVDLQDNLTRTGYAGAGRVHCTEALRWLKQSDVVGPDVVDPEGGHYGLVLLDPPYRMGDPTTTLEALSASGLLEGDACVVVGHSSRLALSDTVGNLHRCDRRKYGDNAIAFYRVSAG